MEKNRKKISKFQDKYYHRSGVGVFVEYEISKFIGERISSGLQLGYDVTSFEKFGLMGGKQTYFINQWLAIWLLKYRFGKIDEYSADMVF